MKINKKLISVLLLSMAIIIPLSCKKGFLSQTNQSSADAAATFTKSQDVVALVNAIYDGYQNSDLLKKSIWYYANFFTHDWYNDGADIAWNSYTISPNFAAINTFWDDGYLAIGRANAALNIIATAQANGVVTQALGNRLMGEAYFLRGMTYYYLAGTFGGVPLVTQEYKGGQPLAGRSTQAQVFTQVVADMQQAEKLLVSKTQLASTDLGRATTGAAYAYEGSAQMWLGNYTAALAAFNNPELSNYQLVPDYINVNEFNNQNNEESLFEIQFDLPSGESQSWDGGWQAGGEIAWIDDFSWPHEISAFGYDYGNPGLEYSYEPGDRRKNATIVGPGDTLQSPGIIAKWGGIKGYAVVQAGFANGVKDDGSQQYPSYAGDDGKIINTCGALRQPWYGNDGTRSGYYCAKKWRDPTLTGANGTSAIFGSQDQVLMRYAEVLLSRAECKIHTGDIPGAMADIQTVRDRAWGKGVPGGTAAPTTMQDIVVSATADSVSNGKSYYHLVKTPVTDPMQMVLREYRHELSGDYSLFYVLRRAGSNLAAAFIQHNYNTNSSILPQPYPYGPTADGQLHGVWITSLPAGKDICPIPEPQIGLNPNLTQTLVTNIS